MYVIYDEFGGIGMASNSPFDGCVEVDYDVVYVNGAWYKSGEDPAAPSENDLLMLSLRGARDTRIAATDFYLASDYPIGADDLAAIKTYRQALRDLPAQPGAPWDGGGELTPWPELPSVG